MFVTVWVLLWADRAPADARSDALVAITAERLSCDELKAPPPGSRAHELMRQAAEAYQGMRFAEAKQLYDAAIADAIVGGAAGLDSVELGDLYLGRALALEASGTSGFDDFVHAARIAPSRLLDPGRSPPSALQSFARAQQAVRDSRRGTLIVEAPVGASVFLDGDPAGRAPLRVEALPWGERLVRVEAAGRLPASARVDHAGAETRVRLAGTLAGPPTLVGVLAEARSRGVATALIVTVPPSGDVVVERVAVSAGRVDAVERTSLSGLRASLRRLLAPPSRPRRVAVWAVGGVLVGAAITTAVILLTGDGDGGGIRPSLDPSDGTHPQ